MEKIILVDGNNLLFRSYYATAYNGNFMKNSKGFPTNALFGFMNMINKIILEENPVYIMVAFDKGKTFRHEKYTEYKGGRIETPEELKMQFPVAKELLVALGIQYYECDLYEADDIIGTFAQFCDQRNDVEGTIISSDKDLLQLISTSIDIKLLKTKDYIRYNVETFKEAYGIEPIQVIDLKALMGDASDHIPGVKGIGEKTALKLLQQYKTLDGIYENLDSIKGSLREKLAQDKENAYMSYDLATIYKEVPIKVDLEEIRFQKKDHKKLNTLYEELEFYSFLKKEEVELPPDDITFTILQDLKDLDLEDEYAFYVEMVESNYHKATILGISIYNEKTRVFIPFSLLQKHPSFFLPLKKYTYDIKRSYVALKWYGMELSNVSFDTMIAASLLDYNTKEDVSYLAGQFSYKIPFKEELIDKKGEIKDFESFAKASILKAKFIYETRKTLEEKLEKEGMNNLFYEIEMPLTFVLGDMEYDGVFVSKKELETMKTEMEQKIEEISKDIFELAGCTFNISSPQQLGEVLFEKLGLPHGKKGKNGYSTAVDVLNKLSSKHPIIDKILDYRMYTKLYTTYIEGLIHSIMEDGKIHTIYMQVLTRTGRLSSIEPNLQNIPARNEYGRLIKKAFLPSENSIIVSSDYSQIELRILAHMAGIEELIHAFSFGKDIHMKTASDIFHVEENKVTKEMRRIAKAVNFGIIYGISSFGLSENIGISPREAKGFIDHYLETYPGIQEYMDTTIKNAYANGYVTTLYGRKRNIQELKNSNYMIRSSGERMALNTPIQGTSADIIKKAMVVLASKMKEKKVKSKMILQIHDELVFDVLKEEKEIMLPLIKEAMEQIFSLKVTLEVEISSGNTWYEAK